MLQAIIPRTDACLVIHGSAVEHHAYPFRLALRVSIVLNQFITHVVCAGSSIVD